MVRVFATSAGGLRAGEDPRTGQSGAPASVFRDKSFLDRAVPVLVCIFLLVASISIAHQFTSSRDAQLQTSEASLSLAAHLVASEIARTEAGGQLTTEVPALPKVAQQAGRRFFIIDSQGIIRASNGAQAETGRMATSLFTAPLLRSSQDGGSLLERVPLADGQMVSVASLPLAVTGSTLIAYESLEQELRPWRRHAHVIGGILACFGAVTIAFSLAYYAQRERTMRIGARANQLHNRFEVALDHGRCSLWDWPIGSLEIILSSSMHRVLGLSPKETINLSGVLERLHPADCDLFQIIAANAQRGDREFDHLFRMRHADGSWVWLRMRAVIADQPGETSGTAAALPHLLGVVMDVTAERVAEEEAHRTDTRLRDAIESISEAFVLWDENNRLVMCNSKYQAFHGIPAELARRGAPYRALMDAAREPRVLIEIDCGSNADSTARSYEAQLQDGRWLLISERHTGDGGYVSVGTDITARKLQEDRLIENERQLRMTITDLGNSREALRRQAAQLTELAERYLEQKAEAISANRAKAEFLANMNHEIRTPLNHIIGFAEMIEAQIFGRCGSPRYVEYASDIRKSGANLLTLISDILDMARVEAGRVTLDRISAPIGVLLEKAASEVRDVARAKNVVIEVEPDSTETAGQRLIHVDPVAMTQAMTHLLRNSIRLSPADGRVSVRARLNGDHINIFIADSGCVLTKRELGTIVDAFGHIDGMLEDGCKGSGLGIPIARSLIELHGGTMRLRSAPQFGALVMIHLPIAHRPVQLDLPMGPL